MAQAHSQDAAVPPCPERLMARMAYSPTPTASRIRPHSDSVGTEAASTGVAENVMLPSACWAQAPPLPNKPSHSTEPRTHNR